MDSINKNEKLNNILLIGLCIILFITPLIYFGEVRGDKAVKDFLGQLLIFILFIIYLVKREEISFELNNLNQLIFLFITLIFISFLVSDNYYLSFLGLKKWLSYIVIYILAVSILKEFKSIDQVFYVLIGVGFLTALFGIMNFYGFHYDSVIEDCRGRGRVISTFGNPNYLSSFIGPLLPLNFYLLLTEDNNKLKTILFTTFSIIYAALLFTQTRGILLGLIFISFFIIFCIFFVIA
jgi:hypothetical protein